MTTIILTIVGILIAAIAALMVLWYGGEAFETGLARAQANTSVNNVQQVANGVALRNARTGLTMDSASSVTGMTALLQEGYLSSVPTDAMTGVPGSYGIVDEAGSNTGKPAKWVYTIIGASTDAHAKQVCRTIERNMRRNDPSDHIDRQVRFDEWTAVHRSASCIYNYYSNSFLLYAPV